MRSIHEQTRSDEVQSRLLRAFIGQTARLLDEWGGSATRRQALRAAARLLDEEDRPRPGDAAPLTPEGYAQAVVRLAQQLGGAMQCDVATDHLRFTGTSCCGRAEDRPTQSLCHLWWESVRRIAATRFGYGKVVVVPQGAEACEIRLYLQPPPAEVEVGASSLGAVDRPARRRAPGATERAAEATIHRLQAQVQYLEQRTQELETALEERKLIEKAKGILMERLRLSEADAMRKLQRESQTRNLKLAAIAQILVQAGEML
jgi:hypothetical protein